MLRQMTAATIYCIRRTGSPLSTGRRVSALQHPGEIEAVVILAGDKVNAATVADGHVVVAIRLSRFVPA
jgi:hypothetical protein